MSIPGTITPSFTPLYETSNQVVAPGPFPSGFDAGMAALMGQACQLTYLQYGDAGAPVDLSLLTLVPGVASYTQIGSALTWTEAIGLGTVQPGSAGLATVPYGFAFAALDESKQPVFNVIAFRGTRTYAEWVSDGTAVPGEFGLAQSGYGLPALVHGGFYDLYNAGGANPPAAGTLGDQVRTILATIQTTYPGVPLYITGHSLGGALAELCAADVGSNLASGYFSRLYEYSLASPQVAAGITTSITLLGVQMEIPTSYFTGIFKQAVASGGAYRVVNAADIIPILPFTFGTPTGWGLEFAPSIPAANTLSWLVQTGDVGNNHACDMYAGFLDQLANSWPPSATQDAAPAGKIAVPAIGPADAAVPA
jgi:triacylglycerol lipase